MLFRHMDDTVCNSIDYDSEDSEKNDDDNDDNGHLVEEERGVWPSGNKENIDKETSSLLLLELQSQMGNLLGSFEYKI